MERHKCKLCARTFANGRALGGHMKAHLATLRLPPKTPTTDYPLSGDRTESASSSYSSYGEEQEQEISNREVEDKEKAGLAYGLRENPKKSFKFADPGFSFTVDAGSVVQDRESETESRNPTRRRSKRTRKSDFGDNQKQNFEWKKPKLKTPSSVELPSPQPAEAEQVSSVSDTSPEEDVAMCLMMLSRDVWIIRNDDVKQHHKHLTDGQNSIEEIKASKFRGGKFRCDKCTKLFRSSQALMTHKKICSLNGTDLRNGGNERIFECPYCLKVFGSGQALGGHKRSHLMGSYSSTTTALAATAAHEQNDSKTENNLIDLNLPAPIEDEEFSVVSDA